MVSSSQASLAFDMGTGLAAVDNMGDTAQPAATLRVGWSKDLFTQAYYWGRDFGPVSERQGMLTFGVNKTFPKLGLVTARYGIVALAQRTTLYKNAMSKEHANAPEPVSETNYNAGGLLGVALPYNLGKFKIVLNWDSHIFMVGGGAIIFIASGRRQTLALTAGVEI